MVGSSYGGPLRGCRWRWTPPWHRGLGVALPELVSSPTPPLRVAPPALVGRNTGRRYVAAALRHAIERVAGAGEGTRNATLNAEMFALARFLAGGHLTSSEIANALAAAAFHAGLTETEISKTLASALRAGGGA